MLPRLADQLIDRRARLRRLLARKNFFHPAAVLLQQLQRHEQLAPRRIPRQSRDHLHQALGETGVAREMIGRLRRPRATCPASENSADEVSLM